MIRIILRRRRHIYDSIQDMRTAPLRLTGKKAAQFENAKRARVCRAATPLNLDFPPDEEPIEFDEFAPALLNVEEEPEDDYPAGSGPYGV